MGKARIIVRLWFSYFFNGKNTHVDVLKTDGLVILMEDGKTLPLRNGRPATVPMHPPPLLRETKFSFPRAIVADVPFFNGMENPFKKSTKIRIYPLT